MSSNSARLGLPYIQANQAQKHVTHNEALRGLDTLVQLTVEGRTATAPPATPADGDVYAVAQGATGDWAGQDLALAVFDASGWHFVTPQSGWVAWDRATAEQIVFDGTSWGPAAASLGAITELGINAAADAVNRLSVKSDATLLSHDASGGHQLKLNKATVADTGSLLFQTGWSGRAEIGLAGEDNLSFKVSPDGSTFHTGLTVDHTSGFVTFPSGVDATPAEFGTSPAVSVDYIAARGGDLFTNGTGVLGNTYNLPSGFAFDPMISPNLPGAYSFAGHWQPNQSSAELIAVNPSQVYRLRVAVYQDAAQGDFSTFTHGDRHSHYMGVDCYDVDGNQIVANTHMRFRHAGIDSMTELAAPLSPGDTTVQLVDAAGWNETSTSTLFRGMAIYGYRNSFGFEYDYYTRIVAYDLFDLGDVDKTTNTITLKAPLPASMGNPDDPNGTWSAGTRLANSSAAGVYKYAFLAGTILPQTETWYQSESYMGGIDTSGTHNAQNFPPGTAFIRLVWLPNFSNRSGGYGAHPDTGTDHKVRFAGISVTPIPIAGMEPVTSGNLQGRQTLYVPKVQTGANPSLTLQVANTSLTPL